MRIYRITVNGKTYQVKLDDPNASPVSVRVDGKPFEVYVEWEGVDDEATVTPEIRLPQPNEPLPAPSAKPPRNVSQPHIREDDAAATATLTAPMPGTILSIAVGEGDRLQRGQDICVLEAMKMKNSIKSPREGTIAEVMVSAGATVAYGDPLVRFQ
jgi:biotin carboxyl carrier protein